MDEQSKSEYISLLDNVIADLEIYRDKVETEEGFEMKTGKIWSSPTDYPLVSILIDGVVAVRERNGE